jgi:hypothetical protein
MSYTTIHLVQHGGLAKHEDFNNSWGSAMYVWTSLNSKYLAEPGESHTAFLFSESKFPLLWKLAIDARLAKTERIVHATTFDRAMVKRENLLDLADRFDEFVELHPPGKYVCSLPQQAESLRRIIGNSIDCVGVCWTQTSVASDVWQVPDESTEESRWYDIDRDKGHFFIYDDPKIVGPQ